MGLRASGWVSGLVTWVRNVWLWLLVVATLGAGAALGLHDLPDDRAVAVPGVWKVVAGRFPEVRNRGDETHWYVVAVDRTVCELPAPDWAVLREGTRFRCKWHPFAPVRWPR